MKKREEKVRYKLKKHTKRNRLSVFKSNKIEYIAEILKNVKHDKKNFNNKIMISLLEEVGKSNFDFEVGEDEIKKSIEYYNRLIS